MERWKRWIKCILGRGVKGGQLKVIAIFVSLLQKAHCLKGQ